jgi:hypothetical protein
MQVSSTLELNETELIDKMVSMRSAIIHYNNNYYGSIGRTVSLINDHYLVFEIQTNRFSSRSRKEEVIRQSYQLERVGVYRTSEGFHRPHIAEPLYGRQNKGTFPYDARSRRVPRCPLVWPACILFPTYLDAIVPHTNIASRKSSMRDSSSMLGRYRHLLPRFSEDNSSFTKAEENDC